MMKGEEAWSNDFILFSFHPFLVELCAGIFQQSVGLGTE
jgi:hypothetical protein